MNTSVQWFPLWNVMFSISQNWEVKMHFWRSFFQIAWRLHQNLYWKLGQEIKLFCFDIDKSLKNIFLGIKFFVFQDRKLKVSASVWNRISSNLTKFQLIQLIQSIFISVFSIRCLIELRFCEASRNSFSSRCWKFQFSILKNKKVLFLKNTI